MGWFKKLFGGEACGTGGDEPTKNPLGLHDSIVKLNEFILTECEAFPDHVLAVTTSVLYGVNTEIRRVFWLRWIDGKINYVATDTLTNDISVEHYADGYNLYRVLFGHTKSEITSSVKSYTVSWNTEWISLEDVPARAVDLAKKAISESPEYTYGYAFADMYVSGIADNDAYLTFESGPYGNLVSHRPWVLDLALDKGLLNIRDDAAPYKIHNYLLVDRKLLDDTNWRRWVHIDPARRLSHAALKIVPRGTAKGKVAYYDITFDFDREDLAGVAFSVGELLKDAIEQTFPLEYNGDWQRNYDSFLNPELIQVRFMGFQSSLLEWLESQRESVTNLEKPYLSPNQPIVEFTGHKFQITTDYYIDYTEWNASNERN